MDDLNIHGKVGKLLPKSLTTKRPWRKQPSKESFGSTASSEEIPRGRSPHTREPHYYDTDSDRNPSTSQSFEIAEPNGRDEHDDTVSPLAYDSDPDISPRRPTPSTHPSQIGHLTTSSPIIQAEHAPAVHHLDELATQSNDSLSGSGTYSVSVSSAVSPTPGRRASISKPALQPPQTSSSRRSKSPAGRIKDAFKSNKKLDKTDSTEQSEIAGGVPNLTAPVNEPPPLTTDSGTKPLPPANPSRRTGDAQLAATENPRRRTANPTPIDVSRPPRTPPSDQGAPVIVNTPPTPTDPSPLARQDPPRRQVVPEPSGPASHRRTTSSPTSSTVAQRRGRSGSNASIGPSKLSNISLPPLTPTPENAVPTTPGGGFFSSVLSAAQNAANTFSTAVTNTNITLGGNNPKIPIPAESQEGDGDTTEVETPAGRPQEVIMSEPAVKTLGQGDLSLSHLGIQDTGSATPTPHASKFPEHVTDSRSRSESAPDPGSQASGATSFDEFGLSRPRSVYESTGDKSPGTSVYEGKSGIHRSGSIRSAIGRRRKRGSTGGTAGTSGTGNTIGAAIAAANASVAHPNATGSAPKLTGFAVASKKRNRDFHTLFKSVPDDDYLIEDYSCALQREILAHGRLYVSEGHLCFSSNIMGWVTTLVMSFDEIVSVEKKTTALVFKNGLLITTLHAKHVFASFASRDSTYDLIINIWKLGHPTLRSSLNGVALPETGGDKTEKVDGSETQADHSGSGSEVEDDDASDEGTEEVYDEDEEDEDVAPMHHEKEASPTDTEGERLAIRKASGALAANGISEKPKDGAPLAGAGVDFPGPAAHAPTDCGDAATHYERPLGDEIIPAPLGKVYSLIFGPASVSYMSKWLTGEQKCTDLQMEDKIGLTQDNRSRGYTYIKPLNASIGPRQTKCIVTETLESIDLEKSVNVLIVTQNPDVPSGNVFSVKTKYCFTWADNNSTRVVVNCTIEWTGKSWLKGPIEKGANDGQIQYCKDLFASIKAAVSSRPRSATLPAGAAGKGKKKRTKRLHKASKESLTDAAEPKIKKRQDWGVLEPLHGVLGPIVNILEPLFTSNLMYGLLVGLLVASWFTFGLNIRPNGVGYSGPGLGFPTHPDRLVAYEEIWRREESDLWDWLEERVGMHRLNDGSMPSRKRVIEPRTVEEKLRGDRMNEREIEEAIRVTEEKLQVLREVHEKKSGNLKQYTRPTTRPETDK